MTPNTKHYNEDSKTDDNISGTLIMNGSNGYNELQNYINRIQSDDDGSKRSSTHYPQLYSDKRILDETPLHIINEDRHEILTITIDLGNGNLENIVVHEGDDPVDLANQFG